MYSSQVSASQDYLKLFPAFSLYGSAGSYVSPQTAESKEYRPDWWRQGHSHSVRNLA